MSRSTPSPDPSEESRRTSGDRPARPGRLRRALTRRGVVLLTLLGGALLLISSTMTWVTATGLGATSSMQQVEIAGAQLAETVTAMGLVGLAAGVAVTIARRLGRVVIGAVLFGAAVIALLAVRAVFADPGAAASTVLGEVTGTTAQAENYDLTLAVWLGFLGAALLLVSSLALLIISPQWPDRTSRRYQVSTRPAANPAAPTSPARPDARSDAEGHERSGARPDARPGPRPGDAADGPDEFDLWDGLSEGDDPTDPRR